MKEVWKDIPNYEGKYQVSNLGNVRRFTKKTCRELTPFLRKNGYYFVNLFKNKRIKQYKVSQLIAMAFLNHKPKESNLVVDHIDENKTNDKLENIQIITVRQNTVKSLRLKNPKKLTGAHKTKSGKFNSIISINGKTTYLGLFDTEIEAHNAYKSKLKSIKE